MEHQGRHQRHHNLETHGITNANTVWWNLSTPSLYEHALQRHEGLLAHLGPLVVRTGQYTGRSPRDKYIVQEASSQDRVWWGEVNQPFAVGRYEVLRARLMAYLQGKDLYVQDCSVGADPAYRVPIRVITESAWHNLFARNMFIQEADPARLAHHVPLRSLDSRCPRRAQTSRPRCCSHGLPGRTRRPMTPRHGNWRGCSPRTFNRLLAMSRQRYALPAPTKYGVSQ